MTLTKKQMDQLLEAAMSNLHDMINEGARIEIANLKQKILNQEKAIRKARYQLANIRIEADKGTSILTASDVDDNFTPRKVETPNPSAMRNAPGSALK